MIEEAMMTHEKANSLMNMSKRQLAEQHEQLVAVAMRLWAARGRRMEDWRDPLTALSLLEGEDREGPDPRCFLEAISEAAGAVGYEGPWPPEDARDIIRPLIHSTICTQCGEELPVEDSSSTASPTGEPKCAVCGSLIEKFRRDFYPRHDHRYSGIEILQWLEGQLEPTLDTGDTK